MNCRIVRATLAAVMLAAALGCGDSGPRASIPKDLNQPPPKEPPSIGGGGAKPGAAK
jgi:hypothetical protein